MTGVRGRWSSAAGKLLPEMRAWRRTLHQTPELSNHESTTRTTITNALRELGIPFRTYDGFYGVLAQVGPKDGGPVVALRADMDALPVTEETGLPFASTVPGRMHACGHDVHMAALLGAGALLAGREKALSGPVKLLFQPAEEEGDRGGALPFLRRGCFERPLVDFIVGQHVEPVIPAGSVGYKVGACMAAADTLRIVVRGRGGHAASPHQGPDAILVASEIVTGLQALVSRVRNPVDPVVVSIGMIHGGTRHNILPDEVRLEGTVRTFRPATRVQMESALKRRVRAIASSLGARVHIEYQAGYPALWNPPEATAIVRDSLRAELGREKVLELENPVMGAEDFARYLERVPGTFLRLGAGVPGEVAALHSATFAPPEESLVVGATALAVAAVGLQQSGP